MTPGGWLDAVQDVYRSVSKTVQSLTPSAFIGRAAGKVITDYAKTGKSFEDLDPEAFRGDVLKQTGKEVAAAGVGALQGAGDVLVQIPAVAAKAGAGVADASGRTDLAAALNASRIKRVSDIDKGYDVMREATGGGEESSEAGRFVGSFAPVGVPGVGEALSGVSGASKAAGSEVLTSLSGAVRKTAGTAAKAAGETGGFITDVASFAADWAKDLPGVPSTVRKVGQLQVAGTVSPKVSSMIQYIRRFNPEGAAYARDAFFGRGKDLRAKFGQEIEEQVQEEVRLHGRHGRNRASSKRGIGTPDIAHGRRHTETQLR